jgi:hypothetical protein
LLSVGPSLESKESEMSAHYGAIYLREARRKNVRRVLNDWAENNARCILAPKIGGWRAVYPQDYGHDVQLAERLAAEVAGVVLHVYMHDDSLLGYSYFRDGNPIDEYCSDPEYLEDALPAEDERARGRPQLLGDLLKNPRGVDELEALLHPADGTLGLASFALKDFARLLNLPNPCTCYEYLMEDDWFERAVRFVTIRGLWRFEHIPNLRAEKRSRRQRLRRRAERWEELQRQGTLLSHHSGRVGWILNTEPRVCPNPAGNGFYVFWDCERDAGPQEHSPPWNGPRASAIQTEMTRTVMAVSPTGRWIVIGHGYDPGHTELWDMSGPVKAAVLPTTTSNEFDFSPDETRLLVVGAGELSVFALPGGELLKRSRIGSDATRGVFDPSGRFILLVLADELALFDWRRGRRLRRWKLGERIDPPVELHGLREELQDQLDAVQPEDFDNHFLKMAGQLKLPAEEVEKMLAEVRRNQKRMMAMIESEDWAEQMMAPRGSEYPIHVRFSRDGQWLLCATDQGPRVYRWAEFPGVLKALESPLETAPAPGPAEKSGKKKSKKKLGFQFAPPSVHAVLAEAYQEEGEEEHFSEENPGRNVYAMAYDAGRELLLYGGLGGVIGCLDLATGEDRTLIELPGRPAIMELCLSRDRAALGCTTLPQFFRNSRKLASEVCIWDYARLLG